MTTFWDEAILDREESPPGSSSLRWEGLGLPLWPRALPAQRQSTLCAQPAVQLAMWWGIARVGARWIWAGALPALTTVWLQAFGFSGPVLFSDGWTVFPPWVVMRTWEIRSYSFKLQADTAWACGIMVPFGQTAGLKFYWTPVVCLSLCKPSPCPLGTWILPTCMRERTRWCWQKPTYRSDTYWPGTVLTVYRNYFV